MLKSRFNIENFSGISIEAILQDLHAKLLTKNLAATAIHDAKRKVKPSEKHRFYKYKIK